MVLRIDKEALPPSSRDAVDATVEWTDGIGQELRQRRKARCLSLKELAAKADLSIGLLSQIERGLSTPCLRSLNQICQVLDMPIL